MLTTERTTQTSQSNQTEILAKFLKEKRVQSGLSQKDVAEKLGYSTSQFISNWERGISHPPLNTLRSLSQLYKINPEEMFEVLLKATVAQVEVDLKKKFYAAAPSSGVEAARSS